jgi:hypothetical protein
MTVFGDHGDLVSELPMLSLWYLAVAFASPPMSSTAQLTGKRPLLDERVNRLATTRPPAPHHHMTDSDSISSLMHCLRLSGTSDRIRVNSFAALQFSAMDWLVGVLSQVLSLTS